VPSIIHFFREISRPIFFDDYEVKRKRGQVTGNRDIPPEVRTAILQPSVRYGIAGDSEVEVGRLLMVVKVNGIALDFAHEMAGAVADISHESIPFYRQMEVMSGAAGVLISADARPPGKIAPVNVGELLQASAVGKTRYVDFTPFLVIVNGCDVLAGDQSPHDISDARTSVVPHRKSPLWPCPFFPKGR
jgi:hypothetical protein